MSRSSESPGPRLQKAWRQLTRWPGGRWAFGKLLGLWVPYTATIRPRVQHLEAGYARIGLVDRRRVRNHLRSIHAVALTNLGEVTSGLAMLAALPAQVRGIVTGLETRFHKKARGPLVAECRCSPPTVSEATDYEVVTQIRDEAGALVATTTATWRLAPR